jgi:hypothetical protein
MAVKVFVRERHAVIRVRDARSFELPSIVLANRYTIELVCSLNAQSAARTRVLQCMHHVDRTTVGMHERGGPLTPAV